MHSHTYQQRWLNVSVCKSHAPREFSTRRVVDVCAFWLNYGQQSAVQKELTYFYGGLTPFRSLLKSTHRTCKYNIRAFEFSRAKHPFFLHIFPSLALSLAFQLPCHRVPKLCFCSWGGKCHVWYVITYQKKDMKRAGFISFKLNVCVRYIHEFESAGILQLLTLGTQAGQ